MDNVHVVSECSNFKLMILIMFLGILGIELIVAYLVVCLYNVHKNAEHEANENNEHGKQP